MKRYLVAVAAILGLAGFAAANVGVAGDVAPQSKVFEWATVVFCEAYADGQNVEYVCKGGHNGIDYWTIPVTEVVGIGGVVQVVIR